MEVDLDRLADYVGGALDGTPDADAVRELVNTDERWAAAHTALVAADALVRRDLRVLAGDASPVPLDVVDRLDRALAGAAGPTSRSATVHSLDARRRWRKAAIGVTASAAAMVIVVLAAYSVLGGLDTSAGDSAKSTSGGNAPAAAAGGAPQILTSGRDYTPSTVGQVGGPSVFGGEGLSRNDTTDGGAVQGDPATPLSRLTDPTAREACLSAIVGEYGGRVSIVDFARFDGAPALVAVVTGAYRAPTGRWIVVVGPNCGAAGPDERFSGAF